MKTFLSAALSLGALLGAVSAANATGYAYRVPTPATWKVSAPSGRTVNVQIGGRQGYSGMDYQNAFQRAKQVANRLGGGTTVTFSPYKY